MMEGILKRLPLMSGAAASAGDVLYYDGSIWERLAKGTAGQALVMNSGETAPEWGDSGGAWDLIGTVTASDDAAVAFTGLSSSYFAYMIYWDEVIPATDGISFRLRTSTDGGSSYDSGATDYRWGRFGWNVSGATGTSNSSGTDHIRLHDDTGNGSNESSSGYAMLYNPTAANYTKIYSEALQFQQSGVFSQYITHGVRMSAADVDAVQFYFASGNITSGTFKLYGLKAS